jgi:hypothetical protein
VEVAAFAVEHGAGTIASTESVDPRWRALMGELGRSFRIETLTPPGLVAAPGPFDLTRFSRFWGKAERHAYGE